MLSESPPAVPFCCAGRPDAGERILSLEDEQNELIAICCTSKLWPEDNSFTVTKEGVIIYETGPETFTVPNKLYQFTVTLPFSEDYVLTNNDSYGDGSQGTVWVMTIPEPGAIVGGGCTVIASLAGSTEYSYTK
jgi:hypothetical protein